MARICRRNSTSSTCRDFPLDERLNKMAEETILFNGETESVSLIPNSEMSLRNVASGASDDSEQEIFRAQNFGGDKHLLEEEIENEEVEEITREL